MKRHIIKRTLSVLSMLFVAGLSHAQTSTENYVQTTTCLDADCIKKAETVQYFDYLGRPKQVISVKSSPTGKDIVAHVEYDALGRQTKSYLPVPQSGTQNGEIYTSPLGNASAIYGGEKIYSESFLESSPLQRVQQQVQVGNDWTNKPVNFAYDVNTTADAVKKFTPTTVWEKEATKTTFTDSEIYANGQLTKNSVKDEDGNETIVFKDGWGQTILSRKMLNTTQKADTYYIYNEYGSLAYVIPPLASASAITSTVLDNLCYQYKYDSRSNLVEKKLPGKDWEYMVYDKQDRLVLAQDANLRSTTNNFGGKGWTFTKYDQFGRVVYTGFFANTATRIAMQTAINNMAANAGNNELRDNTTPIVQNGESIYYTKNAFPTGSMTILSVNYYDTYPPFPAGVTAPSYILNQEVLKQADQSTTYKSTKSFPLASYVKNVEDNNWTKNYTWYDTKGRAIGSHSINHLGGYTKTESELDFTGVPQKVNTYHVRKSNETGVIIKERFVYDNQNRLLQHYHQVDSKPEELLTQNEYNELSQLKKKKVGNNLQSIDYAYNIKGSLTDINKDQMSLADLGGKLFSYKIKYTQKEGITNPDTALFSGKDVKAKYNGNIAEIDWRAVETVGVNPSSTPKRYGYAYDGLNRLSAGYYQNPNNPYSKENIESLNYDLNGNITGLYRTSVLEGGTNTATVIDNLGYSYSTGGNQITSINDISQNPTGYEGGGNPILYDLNGNMTAMQDKGISTIKYNFLNLPSNLVLNKNGNENITINTKYSADGTKLTKESTTILTGVAGSTTTKKTTDYLDGFQYLKAENIGGGGSSEMLMVSSLSRRAMEPQAFTPISPIDPTIDPPFGGGGGIIVDIKTPELQFFPTAEGFYDYQKDQYIYSYRDHLGNVRVSFARNSAGGLEITDNNDYYPFGMNHLKSGTAHFGQGSYKSFKYNGVELQETGLYAMDWRNYMPDLGRFAGMDAMAESYADQSPSHFAQNNPVSFSDPSGMYSMDASGNISTSNQGEINELFGYFKGGGRISGVTKFMSASESFARDLPGVNLSGVSFLGKGNSDTWNKGSNYLQNQWSMQNALSNAASNWNFQVDASSMSESLSGVRGDGGIMMVGGAGDPLGLFDIAGQYLSTMEPKNQYLAMGIGIIGAVALKKPGLIAKAESNLWKVGAYNEMRGLEAGLQAHHVGQKSLMAKFVPDYNMLKAPSILVPELGHVKNIPGLGRMEITRGVGNFTNARQVIARDIFELRRVYGSQGIPNSALQELIQMNKTMYPGAFIK